MLIIFYNIRTIGKLIEKIKTYHSLLEIAQTTNFEIAIELV